MTEHLLPVQRGNVAIDNLTVLNGILYGAVNGCTWRVLPGRYGRWHTVYTRMSRWARSGVLDRVFGELQLLNILRLKIEMVSIDSASIKVHPDGTGALRTGPQAIGRSRGGLTTSRLSAMLTRTLLLALER